MWTRESIKNYAKDFLRKHYWKAFLVCLIVSLIGNDGNGGNGGRNNNNNNNYIYNESSYELPSIVDNSISRFTSNKWDRLLISPIVNGVIPIMFAIFVILLITVGLALEVGKVRFFLRGFKGDVSVGNLFSTFNSKEYFGIVKTQFVRGFYNLLWTFAFIIPGIIKSYEYRMVPYILSEEPNLPTNEAIGRSRIMTDGHKMDMFILDISFWGWYILGSLLFGIGVFFVNPYKEATVARLYNILSGNDDMDDESIGNDIVFE